MKLPYAGEKGCSIIKSLKKHLKKTLPANIEADIRCHGNFGILDKGYNNIFKRKVAEARLLKKYKPS